MLTSKKVKEYTKRMGADIVGIAPMDRFEGEKKEFDPRYIFPDAKTAVVMGFRLNRGCFRGVEEGTYFAAMPYSGYGFINLMWGPAVLRAVANFLEDEGWEAVPITNCESRLSWGYAAEPVQKFSYPVSPDKPAPDVLVNMRAAALAAGLGEYGYSKVFLTPEFGPRQRFAMLLTDAPLDPDPIFDGKICDRCMACVRECSAKAISADKTTKMTVCGGKTCEWGQLDTAKCRIGYSGGIRESSPFLTPELEKELDPENPRKTVMKIPYNAASWELIHHPAPIEGAKGCMRACMIHLEETGRIKNTFKNKFRKKATWVLPPFPKEEKKRKKEKAYGELE